MALLARVCRYERPALSCLSGVLLILCTVLGCHALPRPPAPAPAPAPTTPGAPVTTISTDPSDAEAMRSILRLWNKTTPNISQALPGWSLDVDPCDPAQGWGGVICTALLANSTNTTLSADTSSEFYVVTSIWLGPDSPFQGFHENMPTIVGELPLEIGNLTHLELLYIYNQPSLSGPIPSNYWQLPNLWAILLSSNNLSGHIVINSPRPPITRIKLSNNSLDGPIPWDAINMFVDLTSLDLSSNRFGGPISTHALNNLIYLEQVNISNNQFTSIFPTGNFSSLWQLDISNNNFSNLGPIESIGSMPALTVLNISNNQFTSIFATGNFSSLTDLDISNNNFSNLGPIESIGYMPFLQYLNMTNNSFQGKFPTSIFNLPQIAQIHADFNQFDGILELPLLQNNGSLLTISLVNNHILNIVYPPRTPESPLSSFHLEFSDILFLGGNPVCNDIKNDVLSRICRFNSTSPQQQPVVQRDSKRMLIIIITSATSSIILLVSIMSMVVINRLWKEVKILRHIQEELSKKDVKPNLYSYAELRVATDDFNPSNKLGQGGFGVVYKGTFSDGTEVAVKRLIPSRQMLSEFLNEIVVISNVRHRNLVKLKGCCLSGDQRILVYEYVENKNLAEALWGCVTMSDSGLEWPKRYDIILGIARGIAYLHEEVQPPIIHRDIKAPNILLDNNFDPKIADFGLALLFPTHNDEVTHLSMEVAGTRGYLSPEYGSFGHVSTKIDVYSFGVLVLEIISGRRCIDWNKPPDEQILSEWAWKLKDIHQVWNMVDEKLKHDETSKVNIMRMIDLGLLCMHYKASNRPTMSEVVSMMMGNTYIDIASNKYIDMNEYTGSPLDSSMLSTSLALIDEEELEPMPLSFVST